MTTQAILGSVAIILGLIGYFFYIRGIVRGEVKPHAFTWFIWGILTAIAFFAQLTDGGGAGSWVTGVTALASFGFAIIGLGSSSRIYINKNDWIFFIAAIIAIPVWLFTGNPLWSVIIITVIDAVAFAPTFRKAYHHPETENMHTYTLSSVKFIIGIFALQNITIITTLYPASLVFANIIFVVMLNWRRKNLANVAKETRTF